MKKFLNSFFILELQMFKPEKQKKYIGGWVPK